MKAVFVELDREIKLTGDVSMRCSPDANDCFYASFPLAEKPFDEEAGEVLTGDIIWSSDDNFAMRVFEVEKFLRYKLTENKPPISTQYDPETGDEIVPSDEEMEELLAEQAKNTTWTLLLDTEEEPPPPPPPEPIPEPTEEELMAEIRTRLPEEIRNMREQCIGQGVYVQTEYGVERFSLGDRDRTMIMAIYSMVQSGVTSFPYHSIGVNDVTQLCTVYSDTDIAKIAMAAFAFITFHESYANMLGQWLQRVETLEEAQSIHYGAALPDDLQEYLQMVMFSAIASAPEGQEFALPLNMPMDGPSIILPGMVWYPPAPAPEMPEFVPDENPDFPTDEDNEPESGEGSEAENQPDEETEVETQPDEEAEVEPEAGSEEVESTSDDDDDYDGPPVV